LEGTLRKACFSILTASLLLLPATARASELTWTGMGLDDIVTIDATIGSTTISGSYYAGQILWDWNAPIPAGFDPSIISYCVDITSDLTSPQTVTISNTDDPNFAAPALDGGGKAAWLVNAFASSVGTGLEAAALQVAIWEALYDNDHNLSTGSFKLITDTTAYTGAEHAQLIYDQANSYLNQLFSAPGGGYYTSVALWLDAAGVNGGQDQIATPEPSSMLLLGVGTLFGIGRRRRSASDVRI
jgi:hypothetical protein